MGAIKEKKLLNNTVNGTTHGFLITEFLCAECDRRKKEGKWQENLIRSSQTEVSVLESNSKA